MEWAGWDAKTWSVTQTNAISKTVMAESTGIGASGWVTSVAGITGAEVTSAAATGGSGTLSAKPSSPVSTYNGGAVEMKVCGVLVGLVAVLAVVL